METLTDREMAILKSLRQNRSGKDADLLDDTINGRLHMYDIGRMCEIINEEYLMEGIQEDWEPNQYGRELYTLLNKVNAPRLR